MLKCDSSESLGTPFMTAHSNNSSLPVILMFLRSWGCQCQNWIQHLVSHNALYPHPPSTAAVVQYWLRTCPHIFCVKKAPRTVCHKMKRNMNRSVYWWTKPLSDVYQWNFPLRHKMGFRGCLREKVDLFILTKILENAGNVTVETEINRWVWSYHFNKRYPDRKCTSQVSNWCDINVC